MLRPIVSSRGPRLSVLAGLLALPVASSPGQPQPVLERYRRLEFPPKDENFDLGWQERVALEFEVIAAADLASLRAGLEDSSPIVRSLAARALGIRADKESAPALAELVKSDPEPMVRALADGAYYRFMPTSAPRDKRPQQWAAIP